MFQDAMNKVGRVKIIFSKMLFWILGANALWLTLYRDSSEKKLSQELIFSKNSINM